jgi:hypothetical protein
MSAEQVLHQLRSLGVAVSLEADRLAVRPPDRITPELREAIREHKADIMRLLTDATREGQPYPSFEFLLSSTPPKGTKSEDRPDRPDYREGPPYPDGLGRVKCFYCSKLQITGTKAVCRVSRECRTGIALLITCESFVMQTVH